MCKIRFGPSGNSESFYADGLKNTEQAAKWLADKGLDAFEYSFGRGTNMSAAKAGLIGEKMAEYGVAVSAHAPYYINLANPDPTMIEKSFGYILNTAEKVRMMGGDRIIFHPASVGKDGDRQSALARTHQNMRRLAEEIVRTGNDDLIFCPETMGKINQIGDFREVAELCATAEFFVPTVDFGHQNARTLGGIKTADDYEEIIKYFIDKIGKERTDIMHIHFSKIEYSKGGDVRHLTFDGDVSGYGPDFAPLAAVLKKYDMRPRVICESSGTQAEDALTMKKIYEATK